MIIQLIKLISALIAGGFVMILHELPKAIIYSNLKPDKNVKSKNNIYRLHQYIDPIGILLCITNQVGFSKPYMYRIKDKKVNFILGITGFFSLIVVFIVSICILKFGIGIDPDFGYSETSSIVVKIFQFTMVYITLISLSMFVVNLFPISTFDMGLCIAGKSQTKYLSIIRNDYFIKMLLILSIMIGFMTNISMFIMRIIL